MTDEPDASAGRAWDAADEEWKRVATRCVLWLATTFDEFTADDFWDSMERHYPDVKTHEPRALGHLFRTAAAQGLIENTEVYVKSRRPERHKSPIPIWRPHPRLG